MALYYECWLLVCCCRDGPCGHLVSFSAHVNLPYRIVLQVNPVVFRRRRFDVLDSPSRLSEGEDADVSSSVQQRRAVCTRGDTAGRSAWSLPRSDSRSHAQYDRGVHTIHDLRRLSGKTPAGFIRLHLFFYTQTTSVSLVVQMKPSVCCMCHVCVCVHCPVRNF